jgi:hypothetical protein
LANPDSIATLGSSDPGLGLNTTARGRSKRFWQGVGIVAADLVAAVLVVWAVFG